MSGTGDGGATEYYWTHGGGELMEGHGDGVTINGGTGRTEGRGEGTESGLFG